MVPVNSVADPGRQRVVQRGRAGRADVAAAGRTPARAGRARRGRRRGWSPRRSRPARRSSRRSATGARRQQPRRGCLTCRIAIRVRMPEQRSARRSPRPPTRTATSGRSAAARSAGSNSWPYAVTRVKNSSAERDHDEPVRDGHDRQPRHPGVPEELLDQRHRPRARAGRSGSGRAGRARTWTGTGSRPGRTARHRSPWRPGTARSRQPAWARTLLTAGPAAPRV